MKRSNTTKTLAIAAVAALALAIAPAAKAQVNKGCNNATLQGTFAYTVTGAFVAAPAPLGPYASAGTQTFDGKGGTIVTGMQNTNGAISPVANTGTYTVNPDCTGTYAVQVSPLGITAHYFFVILDSGDEFKWICTDPGTVLTGVARKLYPGRAI